MRSAEARDAGQQERVLGFDQALETVLEKAHTVRGREPESVDLLASLGRVLAEPVCADRDQPAFDRSTRDGYAVRAGETADGAWLAVVGQVRAGEFWNGSLQAGSAIEIMTGAPVPAGANAVAMLEHVERDGQRIRLLAARTLTAGENVVSRGSEAHEGDELLSAGTVMGTAAIALAASCGVGRPKVFAKPRVSIVATGDELVDLSEIPGPAQIRNSNSYGLAALVAEAGGTPRQLPAARDNLEDLRRAIVDARKADLLLLSGGVSMGEYDLVEDVLLEMGAEFFFTGVRMQPGKPVVFGRLPERDGMAEIFFFGLPGNPVSTQVTFTCLVEPLLRSMRGAEAGLPCFVYASLRHDVDGRAGLTRVLPARLHATRTTAEVELVVWQGSGDMAANARANCYAVLPEGIAQFRRGDLITILVK
ncbi:MAG: molybdopterin molybdotransferase MoeA [Edaphobacter sp.]|uniref:molybdopterin molybdotransferase MoeA n=1 Tax=Edaphobacter sp. TaxID=1934404 RepID=UPI00238340BB|nr:gephyrin-like molybdotransferase Glp [Edaphobacter sp.]MDE1176123.1 molybdopterin molybdotransferase MoeA [Edaphobacter sp.]